MSQGLANSTPMVAEPDTGARFGFLCALGAYAWWGFIAVYLKLVAQVPPLEVLAHRIVWSLVFVLILTAFRGGWGELCAAGRHRRTLAILTASTLVLAANWFIFIFAVSSGRVVEASLGYFINPLVSVLLGMLFFRERLRPWQAVGLAIATFGVICLAISRGQFPWISIALAISFGCYGMFRKIAPVASMPGLTIETAILFIPGLLIIWGHHVSTQRGYDLRTWLLLMLAGVITAVPLLLFAAAARRLRLMTMGFLQYICPTCQILLAVFAFHEAFNRSDLFCFGLIWTALAIYSLDTYVAYRRGILIPPQVFEEP